ncbi:MAG: hypothetical protein L3K15_09120 [Thermoplasmata archaeon]|nr:hypothetical protein [Thermoplasmata archaeon]
MNEPARLPRIVVSTILTFGFLGLTLYYTRGHLLYGLDYPGVYSFQDLAYRPLPDWFLPAIGVGLAGGNPYLGFYFGFAVGTFFATYTCQLFARELFSRSFTETQLIVLQALAATFYLFSPAAVVASYKSLIEIVFLSSGALFLVLAMLVRLVRRLSLGWSFRTYDALLLGIGVGLAMPDSFPNQARVLALTGIGIVIAIVGALILRKEAVHTYAVGRGLRSLLTVTLPTSLVLLGYVLYSAATQWLTNPAALRTVAGAYVPLFSNTTYNTFPLVVRILGRRSFPLLHYAGLYQTDPWVTLGSFLWPVLAINAALLYAYFLRPRDRRWVYLLAVVSLMIVVWDTGSNPPFGTVNTGLIGVFPALRVVLPIYFLSALLLAKVYPVLVAFSVVTTAVELPRRWSAWRAERRAAAVALASNAPVATDALRRAQYRRGARSRNLSAVLITIAAAGLVLVGAFPIFAGTVEGAGKRKGFVVPADYFTVRHQLQSVHGNAVLLPAIFVYFRTSWGFQGANSFYVTFNYPSEVIVPGYWGPYTYLLNSTKEAYSTATTPVIPNPTSVPLILGLSPNASKTPKGGLIEDYHLRAPLNGSGYQWLLLNFPKANATAVSQLVHAGELKVGIRSNQSGKTGWYYPGSGFNALVNASGGPGFSLELLVGEPSSPQHYDPNSISSVVVIEKTSGPGSSSALGPMKVSGVVDSIERPGWVATLSGYHVHYLLVDHSIRHGEAQTYKYVNICLQTLAAAGAIQPIYGGPDLQLYQIL